MHARTPAGFSLCSARTPRRFGRSLRGSGGGILRFPDGPRRDAAPHLDPLHATVFAQSRALPRLATVPLRRCLATKVEPDPWVLEEFEDTDVTQPELFGYCACPPHRLVAPGRSRRDGGAPRYHPSAVVHPRYPGAWAALLKPATAQRLTCGWASVCLQTTVIRHS